MMKKINVKFQQNSINMELCLNTSMNGKNITKKSKQVKIKVIN